MWYYVMNDGNGNWHNCFVKMTCHNKWCSCVCRCEWHTTSCIFARWTLLATKREDSGAIWMTVIINPDIQVWMKIIIMMMTMTESHRSQTRQTWRAWCYWAPHKSWGISLGQNFRHWRRVSSWLSRVAFLAKCRKTTSSSRGTVIGDQKKRQSSLKWQKRPKTEVFFLRSCGRWVFFRE